MKLLKRVMHEAIVAVESSRCQRGPEHIVPDKGSDGAKWRQLPGKPHELHVAIWVGPPWPPRAEVIPPHPPDTLGENI